MAYPAPLSYSPAEGVPVVGYQVCGELGPVVVTVVHLNIVLPECRSWKPGVLIPWCTYSCHVLENNMVVEVVVKVEVILGGP